MKKSTIKIIFATFIITTQALAVDVTIPNMSAPAEKSFVLPVNVSDLNGLNIYSYDFTLIYDPAVITAQRAVQGGTLSASWGTPTYNITSGQIRIGVGGTQPLTGSGALMKIVFLVKASAQVGQSSPLAFANFVFNEGTPQANVSSATFTVIPDTEPPVITAGPAIGSITSRSAAINWSTNEPSTSELDYGETTAYGRSLSNSAYVTNHSMQATGLSASTSYHFRVGSTDKVGNGPSHSADMVFRTSDILVSIPNRAIDPGAAFSVPVQVTDLTGQDVTSCSFTIGYDGSVISATGVSIEGSLGSAWDPPVFSVSENQVAISMSGATPLSGAGKLLEIDFVVNSQSRIGITSPMNFVKFTFNSGEPPAVTTGGVFTVKDTQPPVITLGPEILTATSTSATIQWETNERSFGRVEYGTTSEYGISEAIGIRNIQQKITLTGLDPETTYHFRVGASDSSGNGPTFSDDFSFTTEAGGDIQVSIPDKNVSVGSSFQVSVRVSDLSGQGVVAVNMVLRYDSDMLTPTAVTASTGLMQNWAEPTVHYLDGLVVISNSGASPLHDSGNLVSLDFDVADQINDGQARIEFVRFMFNQGWPEVTAVGGTISISGNPDVNPPRIVSGPFVDNVGFDSADIVWFTDKPTDATVNYGTSESYGSSATDKNFVKAHRLTLTGLNQNTTYHFQASSQDVNRNGPTNSTDGVFTTISGAGVSVTLANVSYPASSSFSIPITVGNVSGLGVYSSDIVISYDPNVLTALEPSTAGTLASSWTPVFTITEGRVVIAMGGIQALNGSGALVKLKFSVSPSAQIEDISPITFSSFSFNEGTPSAITRSAIFTVKDVTAPLIEAGPIVTAQSPQSASIVWATDELSTSFLEYGNSIVYGFSKNSSKLTRGHFMILSGLTPNTTYHYRVASTDESGNGPTRSTDFTFTTAQKAKIQITAPDTSGAVAESLSLPILISGLYGHSISSISMRISYFPEILTVNSISTNGTIAEPWGTPIYSIADDYLTVNMNGNSALVGSGTLLTLHCQVPQNAEVGASGDLIISEVFINNQPGDVILNQGSFIVRDNTPPVISFGPFVGSITSTSAEISWQTDEPSNAVVEFGTTVSYDQTEIDEQFTTNHKVILNHLDPATTYHFRVGSSDQFGNGPTVSSDQEFSTLETPNVRVQVENAEAGPGQLVEVPVVVDDVTGKDIGSFSFSFVFQSSVVKVNEVVTTETLTMGWEAPSLNQTDGQVDVSMSGTPALVGSGVLLKIQIEVLENTEPGTATSLVLDNFVFNSGAPLALTTNGTLTILDTIPPAITFGPFAGSVTQNSAEISWQTDEPTTAIIDYGVSASYGQFLEIDSLRTHHQIVLQNLAPATVYHYRVAVNDALGNGPTTSSDNVFTTSSEEAVLVSLSDQQAGPDGLVDVLLLASDLTGKDITRFEFSLLFQSEFIEFLDAVVDETMTEGWTPPAITSSDGIVSISLSGESPLVGSGAILRLKLRIRSNAKTGTQTILVLQDFKFNNGSPPVTTDNGLITILDTVPPQIIFGPFVGSITQNSAEIQWQTDEPSDGVVEFGSTPDFGHIVRQPNLTTNHAIRLYGLLPATTYFYRVASTDSLSNGPTISDPKTFATTSAEAVQVWVEDAVAGPGDNLTIDVRVDELGGLDITKFSFSILFQSEYIDIDSVSASESISTSWGDPSFDKLSGRIEISHSGSPPLTGSGVLVHLSASILPTVPIGEKLSLVLSNFIFNDGYPASTVRNGIVSIVDTSPPVFIGSTTVTDVTFNSATIGWLTERPSRGVVNYGISMAYDLSFSDSLLSQSHTIELQDLEPLTTYHFAVTANNASNTASAQSPDQTFTTVSAEITASLPDTSLPPGSSLLMPVLVTQLDGHRITSVDFDLKYDPEILTSTGATLVGTLAYKWGAPQFSDTGGQLEIKMQGSNTLQGAGVLIYLGFKVSSIAHPGTISNLEFVDFKFNQGQQVPILQNGVFSVAEGEIVGQVTTTLPDTTVLQGTLVSLPIKVSDLTGLGILSYNFTLGFDPNIVNFEDISTAGAIAETWEPPTVTTTESSVTLSSNGSIALTGEGTLLHVLFTVADAAAEGDTSRIVFIESRFNRGNPSVSVIHGTIRIAKRYDIVAGHVLDEDTKIGIAAASVMMTRSPSGNSLDTTTDRDGYFQFTGVNRDESFEMFATKPGFLDSDTLRDIQAGATNVQLFLSPKNGAIKGWIRDEIDAPVEGALIVVDDEHGNFGSTNSDSSGWFTIESLAKKYEYIVRVSKFGFEPIEMRNTPIDTTLYVTLMRSWGSVSGIITSIDGEAAAGIRVLAKVAATGDVAGIDTTRVEGRYLIGHLPSGTYSVQPDQPGYLSDPGSKEVFVGPNETAMADFVIEEAVLSHIEIHGASVLVPNNSPSQFSMSAYSTKGPEMTVTAPYWQVLPPEAGSVTNGVLYPNLYFFGGALLSVTDLQTGILGSLDLTLYAPLGPEDSAVLHDSTGLKIDVPAGALSNREKVRIEVVNLPPFKSNTAKYSVVGQAYQLKPAGLQLNKPIRIIFPLPSDVASKSLTAGNWDGENAEWSGLRGASQSSQNHLEVEFTQFGLIAALLLSQPLGMHDLNFVPNPFSPDMDTDLDGFPGLAINFTLTSRDARRPFLTARVYNMIGDLVRELAVKEPYEKDRRVTLRWDGLSDDGLLARNGRYIVHLQLEDASGSVEEIKTVVLIR